MVPKGWSEGQVQDFLFLQRGFDLTAKQAVDGNIPVYSSSGLAYFHNESKVRGPGIVTGRKGSVGPVYLINEDFWPHDTTLWVKDFKGNDIKYIEYFLRFLRLERFDEASSVPTLNRNNVHGVKCVFPPLPEQKKIAQILSTWDKAISTTEQLLANSQQQKKALMQQLLTGKKRLLDQNGERFEGEWRDYHLSHVAEVIVSPVDKKSIEGEVPVELCNYTDVYYNHEITRRLNFMKATAKPAEIKKYTLKINDVIITKDSETPGDIAVPALVSEDLNGVVCGYHLAIVRPKKEVISGAFLNYLFSMPKTRYYFFTLATGATRFGLSVGGINQSHFRFPPLKEQQKIAAVLSAADQEITTLQQQLDQLKQEKKALMQQLLTGKRRVKVGGVGNA
ncbi:restriction endonuclease subunit S [Shewanella algae]|uniref:restriction endonuclease subunit S n=1 Tax=Shewanella algae TaxID=38313 RepID=UPI003AAA371B